ncbi:MAG: sugar phosphate isomerase/epimerase [Phycisphaerales bacterium]
MKQQIQVAVTLAPLGDPQQALAWLSQLGVRGVQLSLQQPGLRPRDLGASARRDLAAALRRHELVCAGVDALIPADHWCDGATVDRAVEALRECCQLAEALGRVPVTVQFPGADPDPTREERRSGALHAVAAAASTHGVLLADLACSSSGAVANLPRPPVGWCADPAAMLASGKPVPAAVAGLAGHLYSARIVDLLRTGMRGPLGTAEGQLDVLSYRMALEMAGLQGLPVVDARQWADPESGVQRTVAAWRATVPAGA